MRREWLALLAAASLSAGQVWADAPAVSVNWSGDVMAGFRQAMRDAGSPLPENEPGRVRALGRARVDGEGADVVLVHNGPRQPQAHRPQDPFHRVTPPTRPHVGPHNGLHNGWFRGPDGRMYYGPHAGPHWGPHGPGGHFNQPTLRWVIINGRVYWYYGY